MNLPALANNRTLPSLNGFAARSTWAIVLMAAITLLNAIGIDIVAFAHEINAGSTPEEIIQTGERVVSAWQMVAPMALGLWAWFERRAPNFRLIWPWARRH